MQLQSIDWVVVAVYAVTTLVIGLVYTKRAGRNLEQYFLSGRKLPWWLLGTSMVATTFSTDTPNLVTDLVRTGGVSMNWLWWAFLITGMLTVFFYAKLWRRSGALTDMSFYELRYSGTPAAFLRGFRAIYLGVFFNVMIMATVTLAAIKIAGVLLGLDAYRTVALAALVTAVYSTTAGLVGRRGDRSSAQFVLAMIGSVAAAFYAVTAPRVGASSGLFSNPLVQGKLSLLPDFSDRAAGSRSDRAARGAVVEHVVPGLGARRRRLYGAAHAGRAQRETGRGGDALVQHCPLRACGLGRGSSWPSPRWSSIPSSPTSARVFPMSIPRSSATTWLIRPCSCSCRTGCSDWSWPRWQRPICRPSAPTSTGARPTSSTTSIAASSGREPRKRTM